MRCNPDSSYHVQTDFLIGDVTGLTGAELLRNEIEDKTQPLPVEEYRWH